MRAPRPSSKWQSLAFAIAALGAGCTFSKTSASPIGGGGTGGGGGAAGTAPGLGGFPGIGGGGGAPPINIPPPLDDFPADPIIDSSAPANAPALFDGTAPRAGGAPCIVSPIAGTLMPRNWLRPRFTLAPSAGENLFEVTLSVPGFAHKLRIFTRDPNTALTPDLWNRLRTSINDKTITVTARALQTDAAGAVQLAPSAAAESTFVIAPVEAPGKIVYWALADDMGTKVGSLKGFGIGEEGVQDVLVPSQVASRTSGETCVGCHTATPDGHGVGFSMGPINYFGNIADIRQGSTGALPSYVNTNAMSMIRTLRGIPAYSKGHWTDGDRIVLLSDTGTLNWVQVDGSATGVLARTGDPNKATEPTFSHDGQSVVYVSGTSLVDGRLANGPADLYAIPYANRAGGNARALPGGSDPGATEFYPAFSPDDQLIAFTRLAGSGSSYSNPASEVFVVPFGGGTGGTAVRLAANDAAACQAGLASPGLTNDWPKWSPRAVSANGKKYYWLTFSSKRTGTANAQLYVTGLVVDGAGKLTSYPALYLWNQPAADGNHTPSWDDFTIPPITVD
jgi:WD40 repeat protein